MSNKGVYSQKVLEFINQLIFMERRNIFESEGVRIYPSEIHLLLVIGNDSTSNATRMAERLGITKGAVSQTLARLQKKGILTKVNDPYNKNELTVSLTETGIKVFEKCRKLQESLTESIEGFFEEVSEQQSNLILQFFSHISDTLKHQK